MFVHPLSFFDTALAPAKMLIISAIDAGLSIMLNMLSPPCPTGGVTWLFFFTSFFFHFGIRQSSSAPGGVLHSGLRSSSRSWDRTVSASRWGKEEENGAGVGVSAKFCPCASGSALRVHGSRSRRRDSDDTVHVRAVRR